jgi:hypothetical protein
MTDAVDSSTLALLAYPGLWAASCELHPRAAPGYDWREHLRCLCRLARELHAEQPIALRVAGDAERMESGIVDSRCDQRSRQPPEPAKIRTLVA